MEDRAVSRRVITIEVDYHPATRGLARFLELLRYASTEYGIRSVRIEVVDPEELERWQNEGGR